MRDTEHMKRHLFIVTEVDNKEVDNVPVEDPFHTTNVTVGFSIWALLKMLFFGRREVKVRIKVRSDGVAQGRWFQGADICEKCKRNRIDLPGQHPDKPGYENNSAAEHGPERWCYDCEYGVVQRNIEMMPKTEDGSN